MMELRLDATPEELPVFLTETDELLQSLDAHLVRLEGEGPSAELIQEVFRAAHTIKGSAGAIGHVRMARLTHAMETLLDRVRHHELQVTAELTDHLFEALDMLKVLAAEVETQQQADLDVETLAQALEALAATDAQPGRGMTLVRPTTVGPPDGATHHLVVEFERGPWTAVRALQTLLAVEAVGAVLRSHPSRAEVERQEVHERLEAWLATERDGEELRRVVAEVPEVQLLSLTDAAELVARMADEAGSTDASGSEPGSEARSAPSGASEATAAGAARKARGSAATVRIDVERLDHLLNLVGELVIDRTRLIELGRALREQVGEHGLVSELSETTLHLGRVTDELQAEVMKSRMLPMGTVFNRFPRVVRDLATRQGKKVELVIEGQETELDRTVIEEIGDPLVHLLRNAIDHGVESPAEREARGKPPTATVRLTAQHVENSIVIVVEDDGGGIDAAKVRARAADRGLLTPEAAARLSDAEAVDLIFQPGFSTAAAVSDISGRGVGMDIVRTNVERLGGTVEVHTTAGQGSRFLLRLPLTLAIVQTLLVRVGANVYALPLSSVTETLRVPAQDIQRMQRQEAILLRGHVLPIVRLSTVFHCAGQAGPVRKDALVVAVKVGERQVGLMVDALLGEQEVVIKALGALIGEVPGISSAAILGDGTVALIMDVPALVQRVAADYQDFCATVARETTEPVLAASVS